MHRAGIDRAFGDGLGRLFLGLQVALGVGFELGFAAGSAEIIRRAVVHGLVLRGGWIDRHAADRIFDLCGGSGVGVVAVRRTA